MKWGASNKFEKLREISRLHQLWATYVIVGPDSISKSEYVELKRSHLPTDTFLCLPYKAYLLGKAEAQVRPSLRKSLDVDFSRDMLVPEDYASVQAHEERLACVIKGLITAELEGNYDLLTGSKPDLRSLVVKCLEELKVIKNSAYISAIQNYEGVYAKSMGASSSIVSTGAIHKVTRVSELPERNLYDLIFLPENISKGIGEATSTPLGPEGPRKAAAAKPAPVGSMAGAPAAGNVAGPGRPPGSDTPGPQDAMTSCPYGGGEECITAGGNGADNHRAGGVIMKRHAEAMAAGDNPPNEEGEKELAQQEIKDTIAYDKTSHPHSKIRTDLETGEVLGKPIDVSSSADAEAGKFEAYVVSFIGGGRGMMKPAVIPPKGYAEGTTAMSGGGSVPMGKGVGREIATYRAAVLHGSMDLVPPTTARSHKGRPMSIQQWKEGYTEGSVSIGETVGSTNNPTVSLLNLAPNKASKEKLRNKLNHLIVNTIITNDTDKHFGNIVINDDFTDFAAIDGGASFGTSLAGCRNTIHKDMHNASMKVKVDQQTQTRLANLSFKDYRQTFGGNVEDWAAGQTFLRNRYLLFLQKEEGEIDFEKFRSTYGTVDDPDMLEYPGMWDNLPDDEFKYRKDNNLLPSQLFNSWSKGYLEAAANDPDHSDHEDAKTLTELGVFMGPGFAAEPDDYRKDGKNVEYAKSITANMKVPKVIRRDSYKITTTPFDEVTTKTTIHTKREAEDKVFDPFDDNKVSATAKTELADVKTITGERVKKRRKP